MKTVVFVPPLSKIELMTRVNRYNLIASLYTVPSAAAIQLLSRDTANECISGHTKSGNGKVETAVNHPHLEHVTFFLWSDDLKKNYMLNCLQAD